MSLAEWRRLLEDEAKRQGMSLNDYISVRLPYSETAAIILRQLIELIKKS